MNACESKTGNLNTGGEDLMWNNKFLNFHQLVDGPFSEFRKANFVTKFNRLLMQPKESDKL